MTIPEIVIIITTTASGIVTVINAISSGWGRKRVDDKLDAIHEVTNSNLTRVKDELLEALERIKELEGIIKNRESRVRKSDKKNW